MAGLGKSRYANAMQCNVVICKDFFFINMYFPFFTRNQILFFNQKTYISSFCTKINRDYGLPLLNFSGFSLE